MKRIGVTVGKFMPLHKGHELMIEMAASTLDELVIIVQSNYDLAGMIGHSSRAQLIRGKYAGYSNIKVVSYDAFVADAKNYDENGTAIDEEFWDKWVNIFRKYCPDATHVVSSDRYGQEMARRLATDTHHVDWFPVDPDRELINISATEIRADPIKNWKYISKEFRQYFVKKVVVIGAESSGKSTLVNDLAKSFNSPAVPEYGRILSGAKSNNLTPQDFTDIADRHTAMVKKAVEETETGFIFVDTERMVTRLYFDIYCDTKVDMYHILPDDDSNDYFDMYVVVQPNIPWVDDGTRVQPNQKERQKFVANLIGLANYIDVDGRIMILEETDRNTRVEVVLQEMSARGFFKVCDQTNLYTEVYNS
jgi:HTH-type transcriptional repressor of NAD biosynthesis genes